MTSWTSSTRPSGNVAPLHELGADDPGREHTRRIEETTAQAISLVDPVWNVSRGRGRNTRPLELYAAIGEMEPLLRHLVRKRISPPSLPRWTCGPYVPAQNKSADEATKDAAQRLGRKYYH